MSQNPPENLPEVASHDLFSLDDTRIEMAGVMRCCLATVAEEYVDPEHPGVSIGMKSCCRHCSEPFTLVSANPHPKWMPDWVIRKQNAISTTTAMNDNLEAVGSNEPPPVATPTSGKEGGGSLAASCSRQPDWALDFRDEMDGVKMGSFHNAIYGLPISHSEHPHDDDNF